MSPAPNHGSYREAPPRPPPPRPPIGRPGAVAVGCLALAAFTSNKLWTMAQLRGDIDGIPEREMSVGRELSRFSDGRSIQQLIDEEGGEWKVQANASGDLHGQKLRVRCLERSRDCYFRGSVYIDDGNRDFDRILLGIEIAGLISSLILIQRRYAAWRRAQRLVAPPRA